jgi:hypothetical protein
MNLTVIINRPAPVPFVANGELGGCSVFAGTRYTYGDLKGFLQAAGWPENLLDTMAAIGMAESHGWSGALATCGEHSVGLWQININPTLRRPYSEAELLDPVRNAQVAREIYNQQGLRAWSTYLNNSYRQYLSSSTPVSTIQNAIGALPSGLTGTTLTTAGVAAFLLLIFVATE